MANAAQIVAAFRDVAATKSLTEEEMTDLVKDGMLAGLARIYGATVQAEIEIDDTTGEFDIVGHVWQRRWNPIIVRQRHKHKAFHDGYVRVVFRP